jgi:hypothetical protein
MVTEHDDTSDEWPTEVDPVRAALGPLFEVVIHATAADSPHSGLTPPQPTCGSIYQHWGAGK